ncbi:MAG: S24/S26 family peptidase [Clostridia bacterium]|nr:S24/S26 family peptidase [Clostridia bacterium]
MSENIHLSQMEPVIKEVISGGGDITLIASGTSMEPFIRDKKDKITLRKPEGRLKKGDVPFYKRKNGQFVLHRIIGEDENGYILRGDNQWVKEYGVKDGDIIAVLVSVEKNGKIRSLDGIYCRSYRFFMPAIRWIRRIINSIKIRL